MSDDRSMVLGYGECVIRVETPDPSVLDWLREFLGPDFDECPNLTPRHSVACRTDPQEFAALQRRGPHESGQSIGCFALDGTVVEFPLWATRADEVLVWDPASRTFYRRKPGLACTELISAPGELPARIALLRVVREIVTAHVVARGGLIVHGAALAWRGKGYVIAGPKEAGKTTLLLHLLWKTGAELVANDRAAIWTERRPVTLRGMPTIVSVRGESVGWLPHIADALRKARGYHRLTIEEAERREVPQRPADSIRSSTMTPAQLANLLGVRRSAEVPLAVLLFPRQTGRSGGATFEPLSHAIGAQRLRAALFRAGSSSLVGDLFSEPIAPDPPDGRDALCAALSTRVACFDCILGLDAYADARSATRILEKLEQEVQHPWTS